MSNRKKRVLPGFVSSQDTQSGFQVKQNVSNAKRRRVAKANKAEKVADPKKKSDKDTVVTETKEAQKSESSAQKSSKNRKSLPNEPKLKKSSISVKKESNKSRTRGKKKKKDSKEEELDLLTMSLGDLRAELKRRGLNSRGRKNALIDRLEDVFYEEEESRQFSSSEDEYKPSDDDFSSMDEGDDVEETLLDPSGLSISELKAELKARKLSTRGGKQKLVDRLCETLSENCPEITSGTWQWKGDRKWENYLSDTQQEIDTAFRAQKDTVKLTHDFFESNSDHYIIDFQAQLQSNLTTNCHRRIQRIKVKKVSTNPKTKRKASRGDSSEAKKKRKIGKTNKRQQKKKEKKMKEKKVQKTVYLENRSGNKKKFYEFKINETKLTTRAGKVGKSGRSQTSKLDTVVETIVLFRETYEAQLQKGYKVKKNSNTILNIEDSDFELMETDEDEDERTSSAESEVDSEPTSDTSSETDSVSETGPENRHVKALKKERDVQGKVRESNTQAVTKENNTPSNEKSAKKSTDVPEVKSYDKYDLGIENTDELTESDAKDKSDAKYLLEKTQLLPDSSDENEDTYQDNDNAGAETKTMDDVEQSSKHIVADTQILPDSDSDSGNEFPPPQQVASATRFKPELAATQILPDSSSDEDDVKEATSAVCSAERRRRMQRWLMNVTSWPKTANIKSEFVLKNVFPFLSGVDITSLLKSSKTVKRLSERLILWGEVCNLRWNIKLGKNKYSFSYFNYYKARHLAEASPNKNHDLIELRDLLTKYNEERSLESLNNLISQMEIEKATSFIPKKHYHLQGVDIDAFLVYEEDRTDRDIEDFIKNERYQRKFMVFSNSLSMHMTLQENRHTMESYPHKDGLTHEDVCFAGVPSPDDPKNLWGTLPFYSYTLDRTESKGNVDESHISKSDLLHVCKCFGVPNSVNEIDAVKKFSAVLKNKDMFQKVDWKSPDGWEDQ